MVAVTALLLLLLCLAAASVWGVGHALSWIFSRPRASARFQCSHCGYDCKACPELCSECGHPSPLRRVLRLQRLADSLPLEFVSVRVAEGSERTHRLFHTDDVREAVLVCDHLGRRGIYATDHDGESGGHRIDVHDGDIELAVSLLRRLEREGMIEGRILAEKAN